MCEYDPACSKRDHPLAARLWQRRRDASLLVRCPPKRHPLAAVFDLPEMATLFDLPVLVAPSYQPLRRSLLIDIRPGVELDRPNDLHHVHAAVIPINEYVDGETESDKCRCGTWCYVPSSIQSRIVGHYDGQAYTLGSYVATADSDLSIRNRTTPSATEQPGT